MKGLRGAGPDDLAAVNALILDAISTWPIAERMRDRIAPSYCYDAVDLEHMRLFYLGDPIDGAIALEVAESAEAPATPALLLHGIYVRPGVQRSGLGRALVAAALAMAREEGARGLLVKAQRSANGFFETLGFEQLAVRDPLRDYPHRWWRGVDTGP